MVGTPGYMAPEVIGYRPGNNPAITYTVSVDIWAVGVITLDLLLGQHIFANPVYLTSYMQSLTPELSFTRNEGVEGEELTDACKAFVTRLLELDPIMRPSANSVLADPWLTQDIAMAGDGDEYVSQTLCPQSCRLICV
jgi:serine/threonine protein kinase